MGYVHRETDDVKAAIEDHYRASSLEVITKP